MSDCPKCLDRRTLLVRAGIGGLLLAGGAGVYAGLHSLYPAVLYEPSPVIEVGLPAEFLAGEVANFQAGPKKVSLLREEDGLYALVRNCTHMGCIPNYDAASASFLCPCHGSIFTRQGDVVKGPAPAPLFRAAISLNSRGAVEVDSSVLENDPVRRGRVPFVLPVG